MASYKNIQLVSILSKKLWVLPYSLYFQLINSLKIQYNTSYKIFFIIIQYIFGVFIEFVLNSKNENIEVKS